MASATAAGCRRPPSGFGERNAMISHELLQDIHVNAVSNVQESAVPDATPLAGTKHFGVDVEVEIEMTRRRLHPPHAALGIERRPSALTPQARCAQLEAGYLACGALNMACHHAFDRKLRCVNPPGRRPPNLVGGSVVL